MPLKLRALLFGKTHRTRSSDPSENLELEGFMDLPMDVVYEVSFKLRYLRTISSKCGRLNTIAIFQTAMYLDPKDLLQLSRLSKRFRSIFASRSALFVWQTVFRNSDLKSRYSLYGLNEIQFAGLLYDKYCMVQILSFCVPHGLYS